MTAPKPMTRRELIELAALDALGLLDEYEAALYTRSFHHAPTAVQNEILDLQEAVASDVKLLPDEEPDPALRDRVLEFVNNAVEADAPDLAPLATIGHSRSVHADAPVARWLGRSSSLWRAAAFVLCGAVIVMAYFWADAVNQQSDLARVFLDRDTATQLESLVGPTITEYIFDGATTHIVLLCPDGNKVGRASLFIKEGVDKAILVMDLPRSVGEDYELSIVDAEGRSHHVARFAGQSRLSGMHVPVNQVAFAAGSTWQLNGPEGVLLVSA